MNWKLLIRYLSDECSEKEWLQVEQWIAKDPQNKEFIHSIKKIWEVEPRNNFEFDAKRAWDRFKQKNIHSEDSAPLLKLPYASEGNYSRQKNSWGAYFAAVAAVLLIGFLFSYRVDFLDKNMKSTTNSSLAMQEIFTDKGQKTTFTLADGTKVVLNSESSLRIPATFINQNREVYLEGEAYFEVAHIENASFIVHSGDFYTKVLGTQFVVSSYPEDKTPKVAVAEGKVSLNDKNGSEPLAYVNPNQLAKIMDEGKAKIENIADLQEFLGWTKGKLIFNETPLSDIKPRLERWYDIKVNIEDPSLLSRKLTATFDKEPLSEVLKIITISLELEHVYEKDNRTISFFNHDQTTNQK